ncbi:MAG: hypothetical protein KBT19_00205 [Lachnospiraceae bacterium]|nr:hypothetical protein [Candidatus Colinaster equi]
MADEHFWDNGVPTVSKDVNCKLIYETLTGENKETELMTIDEALKMFEALKVGRETVKCEAVKVVDGQNQAIQSFKQNVIDVGGTKMII